MTFTEFKKKRPLNFILKISSLILAGKLQPHWLVTVERFCVCEEDLNQRYSEFYTILKISKKNSRILLNFKRPGIEFSIYGHNEFDTAVTSLGDEKYLHVLVLEDRR